MVEIKPPNGDDPAKWERYLKAQFPAPVRHGYDESDADDDDLGYDEWKALRESQNLTVMPRRAYAKKRQRAHARVESVFRPVEYDAVESMIVGYVTTAWSEPSPSYYGGGDTKAYFKKNAAPMTDAKWCGSCGELKPHYDFTVDRRNRDGYHSYCKTCRAADARVRRGEKAA